jgi:hypothetical protein
MVTKKNVRRVDRLLAGTVGSVCLTIVAVALGGCHLFDESNHYRRRHDDRRCYVKSVTCTRYACYYRIHCEPKSKHDCKEGRHADLGHGTIYEAGVPRPDSQRADYQSPAPPFDAGPPAADMTQDGATTADSGPVLPGCDGKGECADGFECVAGVCNPCPDGICPCRSDAACGQDERCNLTTGQCERVTCGDLTREADCLARGDCLAVYSGKNCTRPDGKECQAGDSNCTCASFDFAVCSEQTVP